MMRWRIFVVVNLAMAFYQRISTIASGKCSFVLNEAHVLKDFCTCSHSVQKISRNQTAAMQKGYRLELNWKVYFRILQCFSATKRVNEAHLAINVTSLRCCFTRTLCKINMRKQITQTWSSTFSRFMLRRDGKELPYFTRTTSKSGNSELTP